MDFYRLQIFLSASQGLYHFDPSLRHGFNLESGWMEKGVFLAVQVPQSYSSQTHTQILVWQISKVDQQQVSLELQDGKYSCKCNKSKWHQYEKAKTLVENYTM